MRGIENLSEWYDDRMTDSERDFDAASETDARPLRDVRAERLLSLRMLARLADVAPSTIYLTEAGRTTPQLSVIRRLAEALEVDPRAVIEFRRAIRDHAGAR
jgi:transcriptional regulator with XRE-family HTH domain